MDGTTATALAPSEDEMNKITEVFGKMRDTVIAASALAKEVGELRSAVGDLRKEVDHLRETNHWLDQQCTELRTQRDQAIRDKGGVIDELNKAQRELSDTKYHTENQRAELVRLNEQIASLKRERDDANFRVLELEEANATLAEKLAKIGDLFSPPLKEFPKEESETERALQVSAQTPTPPYVERAPTGQFAPKPRGEYESFDPHEDETSTDTYR